MTDPLRPWIIVHRELVAMYATCVEPGRRVRYIHVNPDFYDEIKETFLEADVGKLEYRLIDGEDFMVLFGTAVPLGRLQRCKPGILAAEVTYEPQHHQGEPNGHSQKAT
jgi:hypothetical protein